MINLIHSGFADSLLSPLQVHVQLFKLIQEERY